MFAFIRPHFAFHAISRGMAFAALLCLAVMMPLQAAAESLPEIQQLMRQGQHSQALDKINSYLASRPKDAQGRFLKGLILTELRKPDEAIAVFTQLTEDYPELPEPYNNLAVLYAQQKQYDRARIALEMAIRTHPSYAVAYENLGDVYAKLASQAYDKALQLDTSNTAAQGKLALIRDLVSPPVTVAARQPTQPAPPVAVRQPPATQTPTPPVAAVVATQPAATPSRTVNGTVSPASSAQSAKNDDREEIAKTIAAWAAAWSQQDARAYLAFYAPAFKTPNNMNRRAWENEREARITQPAWIKIEYDTPDIRIDGDQATARFRQRYQASHLKSGSNKTLTFVRSGSKWLILSEESN